MDHHEARDHFQKWLVFSALQFAALPGFGDLTNLFVEAPPALESTVVVETVVEPPLDEVLQISGRVSVNQNALAKIGPSISGRVIEVKADIGQTVSRG